MAERPIFDPYGILAALDRHRVAYILIGGFARVIQGADEVTRGLDIVPSTREPNLTRLHAALDDLGARTADGTDIPPIGADPVLELTTDRGELKIVPEPVGTRGYDDLRRGASREPLGQGLRPDVASIGDLARMLSALGREQDLPRIHALRRLAELELGRGIER